MDLLRIVFMRAKIQEGNIAVNATHVHKILSIRYQQWSQLLSMVDTLGLPTIFLTHSRPQVARTSCQDDPDSRSTYTKAVIKNPAISDWFFYYKVQEFIKACYVEVLGATDY